MSGSIATIYYLVVDAATQQVATFGTCTPALWTAIEGAVNAVQVDARTYNIVGAGGTYLWTGSGIQIIPKAAPGIAAARVAAAAIIDAGAESARLQFITAGFGQMLTYAEKQREGVAFLGAYPSEADFQGASPAPTAAQYPMVFNEVDITASNAWLVAAIFVQQYDLWLAMGALIERQRLLAKQAVSNAPTLAQIAAAQIVDWPAPIAGTLSATAGATLAASTQTMVTGTLTATAAATAT